MTYTPKTQEQALTAIESLEAQAAEIMDSLDTGLATVDQSVRTACRAIAEDCLAQRDQIAERMADLPTDAELRAQREEDDWRNIRNEPYGGDDLMNYTMSNGCW
jgi:hypothetical protein